MAWKDLAEVRLENDYARLRPIAFTDRAALAAASELVGAGQ